MQVAKQTAFSLAASILILAAAPCVSASLGTAAARSSGSVSEGGVQIHGPGARPELIFACGEEGTSELESILADPATVPTLKTMQASLALAIVDFSPERAQIARQLNQAGIPLYAWIVLSKEQGYFSNADNEPETAARVSEFEKWTQQNGLRWDGVGLDIEPRFNLFNGGKWQVASLLIRRSLDAGRVYRARQAYSALIRQIQSQGYPVQTYQMPFILHEREMHSTLMERLFGVVDVRGNLEAVMLYTSFAPKLGAALIWKLGPEAQAIAVGSTAGDPANHGSGALDWNEFSRDLIVASHFTHIVGVYSFEGSVRQGFLPRLATMDWAQTVTIPANQIRSVNRLSAAIEIGWWTATHWEYFSVVLLLAAGWLIWRRRMRKKLYLEREKRAGS